MGYVLPFGQMSFWCLFFYYFLNLLVYQFLSCSSSHNLCLVLSHAASRGYRRSSHNKSFILTLDFYFLLLCILFGLKNEYPRFPWAQTWRWKRKSMVGCGVSLYPMTHQLTAEETLMSWPVVGCWWASLPVAQSFIKPGPTVRHPMSWLAVTFTTQEINSWRQRVVEQPTGKLVHFRILNPKSSNERILMAPPCRLIS